MILKDDNYVEIMNMQELLLGDVVIYYSNLYGQEIAEHSGFVMEVDKQFGNHLVWSKWGNGPEVIHRASDYAIKDIPLQRKYYRMKSKNYEEIYGK